MPRHGKEHAYGPYFNPDRGTWRVILVRADGARVAKTFESEADALQLVEAARTVTDARTVGALVTEYLESLRGAVRSGSLETTRNRLVGLLQLREGDRPLRSVTPRLAARLYAARVGAVKPATHRGELGCAYRAFDYAVRRGWLASNPFEGVEPEGTPSRGKPQLRVDEARRLLGVLMRDPRPEATAVMMTLLMGLRAHEVIQRVGRDVDDGGRLLWIPQSKTAAGVRQVAIPSVLQRRVRELKRAPDERLFSFSRYRLYDVTLAYVDAAGVPRVTPHGLRGTFATLAVTAAAPLAVTALAPLFGHGDDGTTMRRHYLAPGAEETANVARLETVLRGTTPEESFPGDEDPSDLPLN